MCKYKTSVTSYDATLVFNIIPATTYSPTNTLRSTIGDGGLNCRVRHGTGCVPSSIITGNRILSTWLNSLLCWFGSQFLSYALIS